jgi:hypothetical protein
MRCIIGPQADIIRSIAGSRSAMAAAIPWQHEAKSRFGDSSSPLFLLASSVMIVLLRSELASSVHPF